MKDVNDKLNGLKQIQIPRRKALFAIVTGSLGAVLIPSAYASHAQKTNITEQIGEFNRITTQNSMELEQINEVNISNPLANRTKLFLDITDDVIKRKQPNGDIIPLTSDTSNFLLLDGSRPMTGNLDLGIKDIINIDGISLGSDLPATGEIWGSRTAPLRFRSLADGAVARDIEFWTRSTVTAGSSPVSKRINIGSGASLVDIDILNAKINILTATDNQINMLSGRGLAWGNSLKLYHDGTDLLVSNIIAFRSDTDGSDDLGKITQKWRDLYIDRTIHANNIDLDIDGIKFVGGVTTRHIRAPSGFSVKLTDNLGNSYLEFGNGDQIDIGKDINMGSKDITSANRLTNGASQLNIGEPSVTEGQTLQMYYRTWRSADSLGLYTGSTLGTSTLYTKDSGGVDKERIKINANASTVDIDILNAILDLNSNDIGGFNNLRSASGANHKIQVGLDGAEYIRLWANTGSSVMFFANHQSAGRLMQLAVSGIDKFIVETKGNLFMTTFAGSPSAQANKAGIYTDDVSASAELFGIDEAGNKPQLTPHNFSLFDPSINLPYPFSYYAKNDFLGIEINIDMAQALKDLEDLTGKKYIYTKSYPKTSWINSETDKKIEIDNSLSEQAQKSVSAEREVQIEIEMQKDIEVTKDEALEQEEIEERELLTIKIYETDETGEYILDKDGNRILIEENPIMIDTGEFKIDESTGEFKSIKEQDYIITGTRTRYKLKIGYNIDNRLRKFYRKKTRLEAESTIPIERVQYTPYTIKNPPKYLSDRGVGS